MASADQRTVKLPASALAAAVRRHPALRNLRAVAPGYAAGGAGDWSRRPKGGPDALIFFCLKGGGWCEAAGRVHPIRPGDLVILPPDLPYACAAHRGKPWTLHWIQASGTCLADYLAELGVSAAAPVLSVGDDLQVMLLFNEVLKALQKGNGYPGLLLAAHALGHLLALLMQRDVRPAGSLQKVAQCIIHMSEHLEHPLKVGDMAALAGLSHSHFTALFKEQTGSTPREYLHLLRMHRASEWLSQTSWSLKEIATRLGYQDPLHFSRQFKAFNGASPRAFRGQNRD